MSDKRPMTQADANHESRCRPQWDADKPRVAHTPGPWSVGSPTDVHHDYPQRYDTRSVNLIGPERQTIATAYGGHIRPEWHRQVPLDEVDANARLIASAPELLDFVRKIAAIEQCDDEQKRIDCFADSGPCCGAHGDLVFNDAILEARALVAKAEGRS